MARYGRRPKKSDRTRRTRQLIGTHGYGGVDFGIFQHDHYLPGNRTDTPDFASFSMVIMAGNEMLEVPMKEGVNPDDVMDQVVGAIETIARNKGTELNSRGRAITWESQYRDGRMGR